MRVFLCIIVSYCLLSGATGQSYPFPLSSLANTSDSIVDQFLSNAVQINTSYSDSLIREFEQKLIHKGLNNRQKAAGLTIIGFLHVAKGDRDEAFLFYKKALPLVQDLDRQDIVYSIVHGSYGMYMAHYQVFDLAIPHLKEAIPGLAALNTGGSFKEDELYEAIIQSYYAIGRGDSAIIYQQKMVEAAKEKSDPVAISQALNDAGLFFTQVKEYERAFQYFNNALGILDTTERNQMFAYVNVLESRAHPTIRLGYFDKGIADLKYVYRVRKRQDEYHHALQALAYLIQYHIEESLLDQALNYVRDELDYFQSKDELNGRSATAYQAIAELYNQLGTPELAEPFLNTYNRFLVNELRRKGLLDSELRNNLNSYMTYRNQAYEQGLELERLEREKLSQDLRQNRMLTVLLSVLFILLLGMIYAIAKWRITQRQKTLEVQKKNNETLQLKNQNLHYELLLKEKDIRLIAADNKIRTSLKQKFLRQLKGLEKYRDNELQKELRLLIHAIDQTIDNQEQLSLLQENIDHINASFEHRLRETIDGISASEMKLCSLIKLGMSNQDIARILHKEDSTIRSYKYRLKKKAGLRSVSELERRIMEM